MPSKLQVYKRPYATHYFSSATDKLPAFVSHGACASEQGAIRATVVRIFMDQYQKAVIIDRELDIVIYTIKHSAAGLQVAYGRDQQHQQPNHLRRAK